MSAESGLKTFRDPGGLWERHDPRELATPEAFARDPALVHRFYNWRRQAARAAEPNAAHHALARLERELPEGWDMTLVTQNVDDLHGRTGSTALAMHGSHTNVRCTGCEAIVPWAEDLAVETACPTCARTGMLRPDIVWFGEMPHHLDAISHALSRAGAFIAIGTSGAVYPAAGYVAAARRRGIATLEFNLEPADNADLFDVAIYGRASETVPRFVERVLRDGWDAALAEPA